MLGNPQRRAVSYDRVSREEQAQQNLSIPAQNKNNRAFIGGRGWFYAGSYADEGISAKTMDRPDFRRMLADADAGLFDVIVVYDLSRFSRSLTDTVLTIRELKLRGVVVVSVTEPFDCTQIWGEIIMIIIAFFAEWYLEQLAKHVAKSKRERAEQGKWSNRLAFGYRPLTGWKRDGGDESAVPDERDRYGYELARDLAKTGEHSYRQIANAMNEAGYRPTGRAGKNSLKLWTADSARSMLANRFYLGEVSYKGEWFPGQHEPLIVQEEYDLIQRTMKARANHSSLKANINTRVYLVSGKVVCASCGSPMRCQYKTNNKKGTGYAEYRYYRCSAKNLGVVCQARAHAHVEEVDAGVQECLTRLSLRPDWQARIRSIYEGLVTQQNTRPTSTDDPVKLKARLKRLAQLYQLEEIEEQDYLAERTELRRRLEATQPPPPAKLTDAVTMVHNLREVWEIATLEERQRIVRLMVHQVVVSTAGPKASVDVKFKPEYAPYFVE